MTPVSRLIHSGKRVADCCEGRAMGGEGGGWHESIAHRFEDLVKILAGGVAAAEQRDLARVKFGVGE